MSSSMLELNVHIANLNIWKRLEKNMTTLNFGWCFGLRICRFDWVGRPTLNHCSDSSEVGRTKECWGIAGAASPCIAASRSSPRLPSEICQHYGQRWDGENHFLHPICVFIKNLLCTKHWAEHWDCSSDLERCGLCPYGICRQKQVNRE